MENTFMNTENSGENAMDVNEQPTIIPETPTEKEPVPEEKKPKNKMGILVGVAASVAAIVLLLVFFVLPGVRVGGGEDSEYFSNPNNVYYKKDNGAVLLSKSGEIKEVDLLADTMIINNAGNNMAVLDEDQALYVVNMNTMEKTKVDENVEALLNFPINRYVVFTKLEGEVTIETVFQAIYDHYKKEDANTLVTMDFIKEFFEERYENTLEEAKLLYKNELGEEFIPPSKSMLYDCKTGKVEELFDSQTSKYNTEFEYRNSQNDKQFAYVNTGGELVLVGVDGTSQVLGNARDDMTLGINGVPDEGNMVVWQLQGERKGKEITDDIPYDVYAYLKGDADKVFSGEDSYPYCKVLYLTDGSEAVIDSYQPEFYYIDAKGRVDKIRVDGNSIFNVMGNNNYNSGYTDSLEHLLVVTEKSGTDTLYVVDLAGEKDKVTANLESSWSVDIYNNIVTYTDDSANLFMGKLNGRRIEDEVKVASDVVWSNLSKNGSVIWYAKKDAETWMIYMYEKGEAQKVDTNVLPYSVHMNIEGKNAVYLKDASIAPGDENEKYPRKKGELYYYKDGESQKIGSDVFQDSVNLMFRGGYIADNKLEYIGNIYLEDGFIWGNLYSYNGKESTKIASDISATNKGTIVKKPQLPKLEDAG